MYCTKKISDDLVWVGGNDRKISIFEAVYPLSHGVSYNSYLLKSEGVSVLFDTVDKAVGKVFFENLAHELGGKSLDYIVVHHLEPDHSATLEQLLRYYPDVTIVCNDKIAKMMGQFFEVKANFKTVKEGDTLKFGSHELTFVMAPMVHWPEVMMTYDITTKTLFSADAFGTFGALNGAIFADEVDFNAEYMNEARRYYTNIVGKYGTQVQAVLKKAAGLEIEMICPLHGFVWRKHIGDFVDKYVKWSSYTPEETGVVIAYASVYGNTENTAEIISSKLREKGIKTVMYDVSVTHASEIIAACFKYSHLIFASTTYNAGIFVKMEDFLHDLAAHAIGGRTVAFVENGSWAPTSGKLMKGILEGLKNMTFLNETVTLKSSLKENQLAEIDALVNAIYSDIKGDELPAESYENAINDMAYRNLTYGLFVLTAKDGEKDNGCIINTVTQVAENPARIAISINKKNYTHDIILKTGMFNISVLTEEVPMRVIEHFGFKSGRDVNKFEKCDAVRRSENGVYYIPKYTNAFISGKVVKTEDCGSHTVFIAEVTQAQVLSDIPSVTYAYYFEHIKPKPPVKKSEGKVWVCTICGYIYDEAAEGVPFESLPDDWVCPLCKHPKSDFVLQK